MKKYIEFDDDDVLKARYDSAINKTIPASAVAVSDAIFRQTIRETDGQWRINRETGEIAKHPFPGPTPAEVLAAAEAKRNALLAETDWYVIRASEPDGKPVPDEVLAYRQALRDLDTLPGWPENIIWPVLSE